MQPDSIHYSENHEQRRPRLYINRKTPLITYILAAVTMLIFLADQALKLITGYPILTLLGAKLNSAIIAGQWWRLITPMFLHADFFHILFNMFALVIWGRQLEALMGRVRYAAIYFLSGVLGCAASFAFSNSLSVGASGAIFGLFGALLYFRRQHKEIFNAVFGVQVLVIIGINIANGFLVPNIDNFGHLGGMAGGFIACGVTGFFGQKQSAAIRYGCLLAYLALLLSLVALRYYGIT